MSRIIPGGSLCIIAFSFKINEIIGLCLGITIEVGSLFSESLFIQRVKRFMLYDLLLY